MTMTAMQACSTIQHHRGDAIIVTTMGAMNTLDKISNDALNVACVPLMGGAASLGLGLALARPERPVLVLDGDASLLMELGGLVSVAQAAPPNFAHFVLNNSTQFAGLGNLETPGAKTVDFAGMAKAAGYQATHFITEADDFEQRIAGILAGPQPAFVELIIESDPPVLGAEKPSVEMTDQRFTRMGDELRRIRAALVEA